MSLLACGKERFINNYTIRKRPRALPFTVFTNSFSMLFFIIYLEIKIRLYCVMFNILQENIYSRSCLANCHSQIACKMQSKVTCGPETHYMLWSIQLCLSLMDSYINSALKVSSTKSNIQDASPCPGNGCMDISLNRWFLFFVLEFKVRPTEQLFAEYCDNLEMRVTSLNLCRINGSEWGISKLI